jgi:hypothetical protein
MKIKTSELTGKPLDYAVAVAEGHKPYMDGRSWIIDLGETMSIRLIKYSSKWVVGGPIIEWEKIELIPNGDRWDAFGDRDGHIPHEGPTPLVAAMRCYVASKLGDEVEIPEELI